MYLNRFNQDPKLKYEHVDWENMTPSVFVVGVTGVLAGSPCLQVAMETQQDALGVAMKVEQRSDQRLQTGQLINLQEETGSQLQHSNQTSESKVIHKT